MRTLELVTMNIKDCWIHERNFKTGDGKVSYNFSWHHVGKFLSRKAVLTVTSNETGFGHVITKTGYNSCSEIAELIFQDYQNYKAEQK